MTIAPPRIIKRQGSNGAAVPNNRFGAPGNARTVAKPGSSAAGSRGLRRDADRKASAPFTQRSKLDAAKTAMKRTALVAKTVQKTPTYPIVENHAQSTTKPLMPPSKRRPTTMTAIAAPMPFQGMFPTPPCLRKRRHKQASSADISGFYRRSAGDFGHIAAHSQGMVEFWQHKPPRPFPEQGE